MSQNLTRWVVPLTSVGCIVLGIGLWVWSGGFSGKNLSVAVASPQPVLNTQHVADIPVRGSTGLSEEAVLASVSARAVYVMDVGSAAVLIAKNDQEVLYPASTTKMLTALVALDLFDLNDVLTATTEAQTTGTTLGIQPGEKFSVRDLLAALLIPSANDAATTLAYGDPLGYAHFVQKMNEKAQQLHLYSSHFDNPSGLDQPGQRSTSRELALLAREVMQQPVLADLVSQSQKTIFDASGQKQYQLLNTNELLKEHTGYMGVKTGTTELAKEMLISQYQQNGHTVLIVVAGSDNRYADTALLRKWVESTYTWVRPTSATLIP